MTGTSKKRLTAGERLAGELRSRIAHGVYKPHTYLPSERTLVKEIGGSLRSISEALAILAREGMVVQTRGRGTRVLSPLDRHTKNSIAVVVPSWPGDGWPTPEMAPALDGIEETLRRLGHRYEIIRFALPSPNPEALTGLHAGYIFYEALAGHEIILSLEARRVPVVVANLEHDLDVTATVVDHYKSTQTAVRLLVEMGHSRIAYVGADAAHMFHAQALRGYRDAMDAAGLTPTPEMTVCTAKDALTAYSGAQALLRMTPRPTAMVATRDTRARGVCLAIEEAGLRVGQDVSVIGFDDLSWSEGRAYLTTFRQPAYELGAVAVEMLVDRIIHGWRPPEKRELETPLILRRSAGPAPAEDAAIPPAGCMNGLKVSVA